MLFGMFFGAGNLIFPVSMGQLAGNNVWQAIAGFLITGVGLPLLGVAALGISRKDGLLELSSQVGRRYGLFFTCVLYLTIGPLFAIPRCATVSFTVGMEPIVGSDSSPWVLAVFSLLFFVAVLLFSLRPGQILTWIGKVLNPVFLCCLGVLIVKALLSPMGEIKNVMPEGDYISGSFFTGFLQGYHTMDALAGLAFGIIVVNVIRSLGVEKPDAVAKNTVRAGIFSCLLMAVIYFMVTVIGAQSRGLYDVSANGGEALTLIARHYFGKLGAVILAVTVTVACLKTAVGLVTSCSETFSKIFPNGPSYTFWAVGFSALSFVLANLGLNMIISYSMPVLMFLYPLAVTLILLTLCGRFFQNSKRVYQCVTVFTVAAAVFDFLKAMPQEAAQMLHLNGVVETAGNIIPFFAHGFGWICPALAGLVVGLVWHRAEQCRMKKEKY